MGNDEEVQKAAVLEGIGAITRDSLDPCSSQQTTTSTSPACDPSAGFEIVHVEKEEEEGAKRRCYLCSKKKGRKSQYRCDECNKPVCLSHCSTVTLCKCVTFQQEGD